MAHEREEVGARQARAARSHDGDAAPGVGQAWRRGHLVSRRLVDGELLDAADVDGRVDETTTAARLAGVLAHEGTRRGEGVVLAHHVDGAGVVALAHQGDVAGRVDVSGAHGLARNLLGNVLAAVVRLHVAGILVGKRVEPLEERAAGLVADGTVRGVANPRSERAHLLERGIRGVGLAGDDPLEQLGELRQAVAARNALATRLGGAGLHHREL